MRIEFLTSSSRPGREWAKGETRDYEGHAGLSYARKYVERGWAKEVPADEADKSGAGGAAGAKYDATVAIANDWRDLRPGEQMDLAKKLGAKGVNSGAVAAAAITAALFERVQRIEFRADQPEGEEKKVFALKTWPEYTAIDIALLHPADGVLPLAGLEVQGDKLLFTVGNGMSDYVIVAETDVAVVARLVEGTFEEPPPAPAAK